MVDWVKWAPHKSLKKKNCDSLWNFHEDSQNFSDTSTGYNILIKISLSLCRGKVISLIGWMSVFMHPKIALDFLASTQYLRAHAEVIICDDDLCFSWRCCCGLLYKCIFPHFFFLVYVCSFHLKEVMPTLNLSILYTFWIWNQIKQIYHTDVFYILHYLKYSVQYS